MTSGENQTTYFVSTKIGTLVPRGSPLANQLAPLESHINFSSIDIITSISSHAMNAKTSLQVYAPLPLLLIHRLCQEQIFIPLRNMFLLLKLNIT